MSYHVKMKLGRFREKTISQSLIGQALPATGLLILLALVSLGQSALATSIDFSNFRRIPTQFIAALGDPAATSGSGAQSWGLWRVDPGPRGVRLDNYEQLKAAGGIAPALCGFDSTDWWLEENGFFETEVSRKTDQFGNIAQVFTTYESRRTPEAEPFMRGINSFQLWHDGDRWWVVSIFWENETPENTIPDKYLD